MTIRAAVIGATGYSGMELVRMLARHPGVELAGAFSSERTRGADDPVFVRRTGTTLTPQPFDRGRLASLEPDVIFSATPNETSNSLVPLLAEDGYRVIDLSGSFRLQQPALYPRWYGFEHAAPELLPLAVYGLPEFAAERISTARLVANPGCYATSVVLPLLPLARAGLIDRSAPVVCDCKSGVSGAGRAATATTHFCEVAGSLKAYGLFSHRHLPEIEQESGLGEGHKVIFTPHLLPIDRGILSTICLRLDPPIEPSGILDRYARTFVGAPFVRLYPPDDLPQIRWVVGTNFCDIGVAAEPGTGWTVIVSCLDNLGKGAAGQALQNMNLMFGFDQSLGLGR